MKSRTHTLIQTIACALVLLIAVVTAGYFYSHRNDNPRIISVKGMASRDFSADLIIWNSTIHYNTPSPQEGLRIVSQQVEAFERFLASYQIPDSTYTFSPISYQRNISRDWDEASRRYIETDKGYIISQTITVTSKDIDKVEQAYRKVGNLFSEGILVESNAPQYYYTRLGELKLEMLSEAATDAYNRAARIAESGQASLGRLRTSSMGVFQILGRNSNEEFSWGGTYNTSQREKTATITVTSTYLLR